MTNGGCVVTVIDDTTEGFEVEFIEMKFTVEVGFTGDVSGFTRIARFGVDTAGVTGGEKTSDVSIFLVFVCVTVDDD